MKQRCCKSNVKFETEKIFFVISRSALPIFAMLSEKMFKSLTRPVLEPEVITTIYSKETWGRKFYHTKRVIYQ